MCHSTVIAYVCVCCRPGWTQGDKTVICRNACAKFGDSATTIYHSCIVWKSDCRTCGLEVDKNGDYRRPNSTQTELHSAGLPQQKCCFQSNRCFFASNAEGIVRTLRQGETFHWISSSLIITACDRSSRLILHNVVEAGRGLLEISYVWSK